MTTQVKLLSSSLDALSLANARKFALDTECRPRRMRSIGTTYLSVNPPPSSSVNSRPSHVQRFTTYRVFPPAGAGAAELLGCSCSYTSSTDSGSWSAPGGCTSRMRPLQATPPISKLMSSPICGFSRKYSRRYSRRDARLWGS